MSGDPVNWRDVLKAYIRHVEKCEGVTFLEPRFIGYHPTPIECRMLEADAEVAREEGWSRT